MNDFTEAFSSAFEVSTEIFGDECSIAGETYPCVIHGVESEETIKSGAPGRSKDSAGTVILSVEAWREAKERLTASGKNTKGARITILGGTFRILNDPDTRYTRDTVELHLGPLT